MVERIVVSETLAVFIQSGADSVVWIDRKTDGLVRIEASEVRGLVAALCTASGLLAEGKAQQVGRQSRQVMEARRLRRQRVGKE